MLKMAPPKDTPPPPQGGGRAGNTESCRPLWSTSIVHVGVFWGVDFPTKPGRGTAVKRRRHEVLLRNEKTVDRQKSIFACPFCIEVGSNFRIYIPPAASECGSKTPLQPLQCSVLLHPSSPPPLCCCGVYVSPRVRRYRYNAFSNSNRPLDQSPGHVCYMPQALEYYITPGDMPF